MTEILFRCQQKVVYNLMDHPVRSYMHHVRFTGRAIAIWGGSHINIHNITAHHCPLSGIRVDRGDYVALQDNQVFKYTCSKVACALY